jgi:hypothetical protein
MAIYRLHRGESLASSIAYVNKFMDSYELLNTTRRAEAESNLQSYAAWLETEGNVSIATKTRLKFEIFKDTYIGGEIPRIDLQPADGGYRAIIIGEEDPKWAKQLRMPLIQRAVAKALKRPENLVSVGTQLCDAGNLQTIKYSKGSIQSAIAELHDLVTEAEKLLQP